MAEAPRPIEDEEEVEGEQMREEEQSLLSGFIGIYRGAQGYVPSTSHDVAGS